MNYPPWSIELEMNFFLIFVMANLYKMFQVANLLKQRGAMPANRTKELLRLVEIIPKVSNRWVHLDLEQIFIVFTRWSVTMMRKDSKVGIPFGMVILLSMVALATMIANEGNVQTPDCPVWYQKLRRYLSYTVVRKTEW